ncbi:MAG: hypothetical protein ABFD08_18655 [Syntrophomonas sp.]
MEQVRTLEPLQHCPLCKSSEAHVTNSGFYFINCPYCGIFYAVQPLIDLLRDNDYASIQFKASALIREWNINHPNPTKWLILTPKNHMVSGNDHFIQVDFRELVQQFPHRFSDRLDRILLNLSKLSNYVGNPILIRAYDYALLFCERKDDNELNFVYHTLIDIGYISGPGGLPNSYKLTPKGWERVYELESKGNPFTNKVFVAMSYASSHEYIWTEGLEPGIKAAGFVPILIKDVPYNDEVTDQMIAEIKESRFIVADFTGQNRGVYYEAGWALGLGKQVIMTVKESEMKKCHFDSNHRNHINWKNTEDLKERLINRIRATII